MILSSNYNLALYRNIIFTGFLLLYSLKLASQSTIAELSVKYSHFQTLPDNKKFTEEYVTLLNDFAQYYRFRNADSLNFYAIQAIEASKRIDFKEGLATAMIRVGDYYTDIENLTEAEKKYLKAKELIDGSKNPKLKVTLLRSLSLFYLFNQRLKEGITSSYDAIAISRKNSLTEMEAIIRHNLGFIYWSNQLYEEAQIEYLLADSLSTSVNNNISSAKTKSNMGLNAICLKDFESAKKYIDKSFKIFKKTNDILWLSRNSRVQSEYYNAKKDYKNALKWVKKSDSLLTLAFNTRDQLLILETYCNIFLKTKQNEKLRDYAKQLLKFAEEYDDKKQIKKSFYYLKEADYASNNLERSIFYNRKHDSLQNLLETNNKNTNLKFLRAKHEYDRQQIKIQAENNKKLAQQKTISYTILFALIASILIGIIIRQNYLIQKRKAENLIITNESKNKILSIVGHDLKTPISTLNELIELLEEKVISEEETLSFIPRIKKNIDYSAFTLNNLLVWAQSQMNNLNINQSKINVTEVIQETISIFEMDYKKKDISISIKIDQDQTVIFDYEHLRIILRNLLNNAIKFTPNKGKITILLKDLNHEILLTVCDTGIGITKKSLSDCFNPDIMYSTKGTNNEKGTGLGLLICKELAEMNNAKITADQNNPVGSCFHLRIQKIAAFS